MKLFDLHCDTIEELRNHGEDFRHHTRQFAIDDIKYMEGAVQTMAVFVPDHIRGNAATEFVEDYDKYLRNETLKIRDKAELVEAIEDIDRIVASGRWAFLKSIESGACLNGRLELIDHFAAMNFKMLGLVWNGENELGSGPDTDKGLTAFGKAAVKRMEKAGMIVDCSHLNDHGFEDLLEIAEKPFVASHSNVRACCAHPRNLRDDQFQELVKRRGLCGVNLFSKFLSDSDEKNQDSVFRHIYHMLELGGEDVIAWGTDFDGDITLAPELNRPAGLIHFSEYLKQRGIPQHVIDKLYYKNAHRFFQENVR